MNAMIPRTRLVSHRGCRIGADRALASTRSIATPLPKIRKLDIFSIMMDSTFWYGAMSRAR